MKAVSVTEATRMIGCGRTKIYSLIGTGKLKARKLDKKTLILTQDIDAFLESLEPYPSQNSN